MSDGLAVPPTTGIDSRSSSARMLFAATSLSRSATVGDVTIDDLLRGLCHAATRVLDVDGVGVMRADGTALRFVHGEPEWVVAVERLQETHQRGPCCDSIADRRMVTVADLSTTTRWPELARGAAPTGVRSVASLPLIANGRPFGALDLYRRATRPWTSAELSAALFCVDLTTAHVLMAAERDGWRDAFRDSEHRSNHDTLTGLPTRDLLFDRLDRAVLNAIRHGNAVAVLFMDIDGFKAVNDVHGHAVGDQMLVEVARRLTTILRANDTLARLSGDEFVIVCEDLSGTTEDVDVWLTALGRRIQLELRRAPGPGEPAVNVSVSIGVCTSVTHRTAGDLLTDADHAMYEAKRQGGGRLVIADRRHPPTPPRA